MDWVVPVESLSDGDRTIAGGKAVNLGALVRAGLGVPRGVVGEVGAGRATEEVQREDAGVVFVGEQGVERPFGERDKQGGVGLAAGLLPPLLELRERGVEGEERERAERA